MAVRLTRRVGLIFAATLLGLWSVARPAPSFDYDRPHLKTLLNNGDPRRHIDLVILSDGYLDREERQFDADAKAASNFLWGFSLYRDYKNLFNVHTAFVASQREGSGIRYAFGSHDAGNGRGTLALSGRAEVDQVAHKAPDCDVIIVLTTMLGRAHAQDIVVLPGRSFEPIAHELGHLLGGLGDEYASGSSLNDRLQSSAGDADHYPNLCSDFRIDPSNRETIRKTAKWGHFLDLPGAYPLVSAYQGGHYRAVGVWRPSYACLMGTDQAPFCPVCHETMVMALYQRCGLTFDHAAYHRRHPFGSWR